MTQKFARNAQMKDLRMSQGWTLAEIGKKFGVSRERVRQVVGNTGRIIIKHRGTRKNARVV